MCDLRSLKKTQWFSNLQTRLFHTIDQKLYTGTFLKTYSGIYNLCKLINRRIKKISSC